MKFWFARVWYCGLKGISYARNMVVTSFEPLLPPGARVLIVGSMPGAASLRAGRYYAHPRNAFWSLVGMWTGVSAQADYAERVDGLSRVGIALWDVLAACRREGSLDQSILPEGREMHDFRRVWRACPDLAGIAANGGLAYRLARQHLPTTARKLPPLIQLPSSSPAHARLGLEDKQRIWRERLSPMLGRPGPG